jgi:hypothetical protein
MIKEVIFPGELSLTKKSIDGAIVVANNLTHLFPYQSRTTLTSTAIPDELDKTKNHEHDSGKAENTILEDMGFRLESKELHGRKSKWDTAGLHPFLVARDSSTLKKKDLCSKKILSLNDIIIKTHLCFVDEFSQRDVSVVVKDMNIFESPGTVLEFDA